MKDQASQLTDHVSLRVQDWKAVANAVVRLMDLLPDDADLKKSSSIAECARWAVVIDEVDQLARTVARVTERAVGDQIEATGPPRPGKAPDE